MTGPSRVLFLNEGALGSGVLGHARVEASLRAGLASSPDVQGRFVTLAPMGPVARLASRHLPVLGHFDADFQPQRWLSVQARRARRVVQRERATRPVDALHVNPHSIALGLDDIMTSVPTFLSVDATVWAWRAQARWRAVRPHSRATLQHALTRERAVLGAAERVVAWTQWARGAIEEANPAAKVVVTHPGIDLSVFRPRPESLDREHGARILFVGGAFESKGGLDLLEAVAPLVGQGIEVDVVTGDAVPATRGVRVHRMTPDDPKLVVLFQKAAVFCLPTHADASPLSLVEAMATETAVVASDVAANRELLGDGEAGVVVPAGDVAALRDALVGLLGDSARRAELGMRGRMRCETHYDATRQAAALVALIRECS